MKSEIAQYYQKVIEITDQYLESVLTDYAALIELKQLNERYEPLIGKENLTNAISRVNYDLDEFEKFLNNPDEHRGELEYLKNNWMPSTC